MKQKPCLLFFVLLAGAAFAQGVPPSNGFFTGREYFPWDKAGMQYCTFYKTVDILTGVPKEVPAVGKQVSSYASVQPGSGYHPHTGGARPYPTILTQTPSNGATDLTGCVTYKWTSPGNYAGWVTFQGQSLGFPSLGVNSRYRYHDWGPNASMVSFLQYNEGVALTINQPFGLHPDTRHNPSPGGGFDNARYGTPNAVNLALRISESYFALSAGMLGTPTQLDLIRGSLPDGGYADNEVGTPAYGPYLLGEWLQDNRFNEAHQLGVEWDFANPLLQTNGNPRAWSLFIAVIYSHNCVTGQSDPYGSELAFPDDYWKTMNVVHVACSVSLKTRQ